MRTSIVIMFVMILGLLYLDHDRKTDTVNLSFKSELLTERRPEIEAAWIRDHANIKNPRFSYYVSRRWVKACIVNYYTD